jgi:hypothetical protein
MKRRSVLDAVAEILAITGPLHVQEILTFADTHAIDIVTHSRQRQTVLHSRLSVDVKRNPDTRFVRISSGCYGLREATTMLSPVSIERETAPAAAQGAMP